MFTAKRMYLGFVVVLLLTLLIPLGVSAQQSKTDVCHLDDDGNYIHIAIADPAVDSHIAHGDQEPGTNGLDENCQPRRYIDNGDGTVLDIQTGAIWLKDARCLGNMPWPDAVNTAANLSDGSCSLTDGSSPGDWGLPSKALWEASVADALALGCQRPALTDTAGTGCYSDETTKVFNNVGVGGSFWSGTRLGISAEVWYMELLSGIMYTNFSQTFGEDVWPVRVG